MPVFFNSSEPCSPSARSHRSMSNRRMQKQHARKPFFVLTCSWENQGIHNHNSRGIIYTVYYSHYKYCIRNKQNYRRHQPQQDETTSALTSEELPHRRGSIPFVEVRSSRRFGDLPRPTGKACTIMWELDSAGVWPFLSLKILSKSEADGTLT